MKMKKLLLLLFLTVSISAIGQKKHSYKRGLKFLSKSEKFYQKNEFEKSLFYLNKYENSVLAYCGNVYIMAKMEIYNLKMKNYLGLKKYDNALNLIDNNSESAYYQFYDSLKVEILFLKYGKEKVIESFANSNVTNRSSEIIHYNYSMVLKDLDYNFKFIVFENDDFDKKIFSQNDFQNFYFISYNQPIHKLIFNEKSDKEKVKYNFIRKDGNNLKINYESNIDSVEFNKLNKKQQNIVDRYILERNPKIISAKTDETFIFSKKDNEGKLLKEYTRIIKIYFNYSNEIIDNYKVEIIDYGIGIPKILETLTFSKLEFETKKIESKELNIDLKKYISNINLDIEKSILENYQTE